ncbi:MAG: class III signal peptide-containing protein [Methanobacterium sp.]|jgi:uncharacterized protein (UPF0333 family)
MDDRGQISAEYLLLIVVILVILSTVTMPLVGRAIDAANDVSNVADAKNVVTTIANAVNIVYANGPGAKRSLTVRIPQNGTGLTSNVTHLILPTTLTNGTKQVNSSINYPVTINPPTLARGWHNVVVYWDVGRPSINVNLTRT